MAKVLHAHIVGFPDIWSDPDVVKLNVEWRVVQTGEDPDYNGTVELQIGLKTLGIYRTAVQMNSQVLAAVEDYILNNYSVSGFNAEYLSGGYNLLNLL